MKKKLGASLLLAAAIATFGVAAPASAVTAADNGGTIVKPLIGYWPN